MKKIILATLVFMIAIATASASIGDFWAALFDEPAAPQLIGAYADPLKVKPGDTLTVVVEVEDSSHITDAQAYYFHEDGFDQVPMLRTIAENNRYTFKSNWEVHSTLDQKWYETVFEITNEHKKSLKGKVMWQDPTVSHTPDEILPGTFSSGEYVFPGKVNATNISFSNTLSSADCAKVTGGAGLCDGSDSDFCSGGSCSGNLAMNDNILFIRGSGQTERIFYDGTRMVLRGSSTMHIEATAGNVLINDGLEGAALSTAAGSDPLCWDGSGNSLIGDCTSSMEYKENVEDLSLGLSEVLQLKPREFDWKSDFKEDQLHDLGFVAQEVETVSPLLATYRNDSVRSVKYRHMVALLTKAIQEQQQQIEELKSKIQELKK